MLAIQLVEVCVILGVVFGAIPPIPVAALGDQQLLVCELALRRRCRISMLSKKIARRGKIIPGAIVLRRPDPDIKVGVDPRTRRQLLQWSEVLLTVPLDRF